MHLKTATWDKYIDTFIYHFIKVEKIGNTDMLKGKEIKSLR